MLPSRALSTLLVEPERSLARDDGPRVGNKRNHGRCAATPWLLPTYPGQQSERVLIVPIIKNHVVPTPSRINTICEVDEAPTFGMG